MIDRVEQLEEFAKEDPRDPFNLYALALEYQKFDIPKALYLFKRLINEHTDYVATYYHFGKLYQRLNQRHDAAETFTSGIEIARRLDDRKALRELQAAFQELMEDD